MSDRARVNIFISADLKSWYKEKAKEAGLSMSAMMGFVLQEYRDTKQRKADVYDWFDGDEKEHIEKVVNKVFEKAIEKKNEEMVKKFIDENGMEEIEKMIKAEEMEEKAKK